MSEYEAYIDRGCNAYGELIAKHPEMEDLGFGMYLCEVNKADRDMGELADISKEEVCRAAHEWANLYRKMADQIDASIVNFAAQ